MMLCHRSAAVTRLVPVVALLCALPACALTARSSVINGTPAPQITELWTEGDAGRDLFGGPGGDGAAPDPPAAGYFQPATYYLPRWNQVSEGVALEDGS